MSAALAEAVTSEEEEMGRVLVKAEIANFGDLFLADRGHLPEGDVRRLTIENALVDTGATTLSLPRDIIDRLGLKELRRVTGQSAGGPREFGIYEMVRLWIEDRQCSVEVAELPTGCPALIGQVPLELMDWVVDPQGRRLIGNPEHGGDWQIEMYAAVV